MRYLGYVCINMSLKPENYKTLKLESIKKHGISYLEKIALHNVKLLDKVIDWNIENKIFFYRMPSYLIPFASHPLVEKEIGWHFSDVDEIMYYFEMIKNKILEHDIRLSAHPDQFTIINSPNEEVVKNSIKYLEHHGELMNRLGGKDIVIHIGGVYGDKKSAMNNFIKNFELLNHQVKNRLRIENDDKNYNIEDVLKIYDHTKIPVVYDFHHDRILPSEHMSQKEIIQKIKKAWGERIPKFHLSSGQKDKTDRKHANYIEINDFNQLNKLFNNIDYDLMLEAKSKEKALLKLREQINSE